MLIKIKRACNEGEYNINACKYEVESLRKSLYEYTDCNVCVYDKDRTHMSIEDVNKDEVIGKFVTFDREYVYVEVYNINKFNSIEEPIALFSLNCDLIDRTYMVYKVNKIVKIEIGSNKELNIL